MADKNRLLRRTKSLIKKCHVCLELNESVKEIERCQKCRKAFLPLNYFSKIHLDDGDYESLFSEVDELQDEDLIKGIYVIW